MNLFQESHKASYGLMPQIGSKLIELNRIDFWPIIIKRDTKT